MNYNPYLLGVTCNYIQLAFSFTIFGSGTLYGRMLLVAILKIKFIINLCQARLSKGQLFPS